MEAIVRLGRLGVGLLAVVTAAGLFTATWPRRRRRTARLLLCTAATLAVGSLAHLVVGPSTAASALPLGLGGGADDRLWVVFGAVATVVAGGCWSLFAFRYSGRSGTPFRGLVACVATLSVTALLAGTQFVREGSSAPTIELLSLLLLATAVVVIVGVVSLFWVSVGSNAYPFAEPFALASGGVLLVAGIHVAQVFESPVLYPTTVALGAGLLLVPVVRYPVFDTLPAARIVGRDRVVDEMAAGVIVVDRDGRVRDANPRAEALFSVRRANARGQHLAQLLPSVPSPATVVEAPEPRLVETEDGSVLELTGDPVTGRRDRQFGYLLVCEDVTDQRVREEQLALLRRFVVDVVGTRMESVRTAAAGASGEAAAAADAADRAERIWERTTTVTELVAHARSVERAIAREGDRSREPVELQPTIRTVVEEVFGDPSADAATAGETEADASNETPTISVALADQPLTTDVPRALLQPVIRSLLEAAAESEATAVTVEAIRDGQPTVRVRHDRPAESVTDRRAVDRASGGVSEEAAGDVGKTDGWPSIAVARLAIEHCGGSVSVANDSSGGHCVSIGLPDVDGENPNPQRGGRP